jgi:DNA-binding NarL/FixJ family response regulator
VETIRVVIADDHTLVRAGIRALLECLEGIEVVGEAGDGHEALSLVAAQRPHVIVTDIAMPLLNGLDLAGRVAREFAPTRVLILSMHATEEYARRALGAGAAGYLLKDSDLAELETALRSVARGEIYVSPVVSQHVITQYLQRARSPQSESGRLTTRQREILRLVAEGLPTKRIAHRLGISAKTVEAHRAQLMRRLDIHDMAGLVRYAVRIGLVGPEG